MTDSPAIVTRQADVLESFMAYRETGAGDPIVFLHGNPTSSYLWRKVMPHVAHLGHCIAPDLIGMGESGKLAGSQYRFFDHRRYLDALLSNLGLKQNVILVVHDWGSALGFDWASRNRNAVKGIAYMEAITAPAVVDPDSASAKQFYHFMRTAEAERRVIDDNMFVEDIFLKSLAGRLSEADKAVYRQPWLAGGESRRPLITWPREIPVNGEPKDVHDVVVSYQRWMEENSVPKLFIRGNPAVIMVEGENRLTAARAWSNQTEVEVPGDTESEFAATNHYIQEVCPDEIGQALASWIGTLA